MIFKKLTVPTSPKVKYFQLKCIQALTSERPDAIIPLAEKLQYEILLPHLILKVEDEELANNDPIEFLTKETEPCMNFTNLKRVATEIWTAISELGSKNEKEGKNYHPGQFFYNNMNFLRGKL